MDAFCNLCLELSATTKQEIIDNFCNNLSSNDKLRHAEIHLQQCLFLEAMPLLMVDMVLRCFAEKPKALDSGQQNYFSDGAEQEVPAKNYKYVFLKLFCNVLIVIAQGTSRSNLLFKLINHLLAV